MENLLLTAMNTPVTTSLLEADLLCKCRSSLLYNQTPAEINRSLEIANELDREFLAIAIGNLRTAALVGNVLSENGVGAFETAWHRVANN